MRKRSVRLFTLLFMLYIPVAANAQAYRKLTSHDFAGTPAADNGFAAYTYCYVSYTYNTTKYRGNYNIDFNVQLQLNNSRSWIRFDQITNQPMMQNVLKHEQGHYNIAYLMKNELYSVLSRHQYTSNYQQEIAQLFQQVDAKYHKMNEDYETQTQHMADARNQEKWNLWFNNQLGNLELVSNNNRLN